LPKPSQRKVRNYLLNKSLQLHYVVLVTTLSALISASLGFVIWSQEDYATEKNLAAFDASEFSSDLDLRAQIVAQQSSHDTGLVQRMSVAGIGLIIVLSLYLIVMTHKVAGPLYKVGLYFDRMAAGHLGPVTPLRKGDMLLDFYEKFRAAHDALRKRHQEHSAAVGRFLAACDAAGVGGSGALGEELAALKAHHTQREDVLAWRP
jgi:hypothetical protein